MTWKSLAYDLLLAGRWLLRLAFPPTKKKLHRLLHVAGTALAVALLVSTWLVEHLTPATRAVADLLVLAAYLTKWQVVVGKIDRVVDRLPIPDGDAALGEAVRGGTTGTPPAPGTSAGSSTPPAT